MSLPNMISKGNEPLNVFPVNCRYVLVVYKGFLSDFDLLIKYRQIDETRKSDGQILEHLSIYIR